MTERCLQVTYRKGRSFAAYLYLSRPTKNLLLVERAKTLLLQCR
jgi:hypothetical protein